MDALIAEGVIFDGAKLATYNKNDFEKIDGLKLDQ